MRKSEYLEVPFHSIKTEQAILGYMIMNGKKNYDIFSILRNQDYFYGPHHGLIYQSMLDLEEKGLKINIISISEYLENHGVLDDIGGFSYLHDLADSYPVNIKIEDKCRIIEKHYLAREFKKQSELTLSDLYNNALDSENIISDHNNKLSELLSNRSISGLDHCRETVNDIEKKIEERQGGNKEPEFYSTTGFREIDKLITGVKANQLIILAARPAIGKSSLALNIATNICKNNLPVAIFSLEMTKQEILERAISSECELSVYKMNSEYLKEYEKVKINNAAEKVKNYPLFLDDTDGGTVDKIRAKVQGLKNKVPGGRLGAVIIDYIQIMDLDTKINENIAVGQISRALKKLAREMKVPIIALSQLNRDLEKRSNKRPMLADLRSSGSLEQDADIVMFIYRDEVYNPDTNDKGIAEINISKHRGGPTGTVKLFFDKSLVKFQDLESEGK